MAELIIIGQSVGANAINLAPDVAKIGAALVAVGAERGGAAAVPLTIPALVEAIQRFQTFQKLRVIDGEVDPRGSTLRRINELLNSIGSTPVGRTGAVRYISPPPGCGNFVDREVWIPWESSIIQDQVFNWAGVKGKGTIYHFELDEDVVPNWFGILVPDGLVDFRHIHIFFHPTPGQAKVNGVQLYKDSLYQSKTGWGSIFHYLTDDMAVQFCGANTGQVLVMPIFTNSAADTCGIFPQRWESLVGQMLGQIKAVDLTKPATPQNVSSVVVSSFSAGISYSHAFRTNAALGSRLIGTIDFDGSYSTYKHLSKTLSFPAVRMWQIPAPSNKIFEMSCQNIFPLPQPRWEKSEYGKSLSHPNQIHGIIPQKMMYIAAQRTGVR